MKRLLLGIVAMMLLIVVPEALIAQQIPTIRERFEAFIENEEHDISIFYDLLIEYDLLDLFDDSSTEFTVFAPTDSAFDAASEYLDDLSPLLIEHLLRYHILRDRFLVQDMSDGDVAVTSNYLYMGFHHDDEEKILVNSTADFDVIDIFASNGIIHVIDSVLPLSFDDCFALTEDINSVRVRVGPGDNRTAVTFLPAYGLFRIFGQSLDDDEGLWFLVDKVLVAPNRSMNSAWIRASDVQIIGEDAQCDDIPIANAPPIIAFTTATPTALPTAIPTIAPIANNPPSTNNDVTNNNPSSTNGGSGSSSGGSNPAPALCPSVSFSCAMLFTCEEAQACYSAGNPALDADGDGTPCNEPSNGNLC